jgi:predicted translin family RNA/ssDNA-binding protein
VNVKPKRKLSEIVKLIDEIKDSIDELHDIQNQKRRLNAAKELIEYIELYFTLSG